MVRMHITFIIANDIFIMISKLELSTPNNWKWIVEKPKVTQEKLCLKPYVCQ
jgi:hypothetical protein